MASPYRNRPNALQNACPSIRASIVISIANQSILFALMNSSGEQGRNENVDKIKYRANGCGYKDAANLHADAPNAETTLTGLRRETMKRNIELILLIKCSWNSL